MNLGAVILGSGGRAESSLTRLVSRLHPIADLRDIASSVDAAAADWWLIVDGDAAVNPRAVDALRKAIDEVAAPDRAAAYGDFLQLRGEVAQPYEVGGWSATRAQHSDYTGPVALVRADVMEQVRGCEPSQIRNRALRVAGQIGSVAYSRETLATVTTPPDWSAGLSPLPETGPVPPSEPTVSVVIPTRGNIVETSAGMVRLLDRCLEGLERTTGRIEPEVVLVLDEDSPVDLARWRHRLGDRLIVRSTPPPFNFSTKINVGVGAASGEFLVLLNDDVVALGSGWLEQMLAHAGQADVGAVGASLRYPNGLIQHAGVAFAYGGVHHVGLGRRPQDCLLGRDLVDREVSAVTAACLVQRRAVWEELGGLDPAFPVSFNDVDYCARISASGLRVVQCNAAVLRHDESMSRPKGAQRWEVDLLMARIGEQLAGPDPFSAMAGDVVPAEDSRAPRTAAWLRRSTLNRSGALRDGAAGVWRRWQERTRQ